MTTVCSALDHTNHVKWLPVFIQGLQMLKFENPDPYKALEVNLGVQTTNSGLSNFTFDHKHEQNNKTFEGRSGYNDLVNRKMRHS